MLFYSKKALYTCGYISLFAYPFHSTQAMPLKAKVKLYNSNKYLCINLTNQNERLCVKTCIKVWRRNCNKEIVQKTRGLQHYKKLGEGGGEQGAFYGLSEDFGDMRRRHSRILTEFYIDNSIYWRSCIYAYSNFFKWNYLVYNWKLSIGHEQTLG